MAKPCRNAHGLWLSPATGGWALAAGSLLPALSVLAAEVAAGPAYRAFPWIGSRVAVWIAAEVHLMFAAFVLGVPLFAVIVELGGMLTREARYDRLAKEFSKLVTLATSITAIWGGILLFLLVTLYPRFWNYLAGVFLPTLWVYPLLFLLELISIYLYYYSWDRLPGGAGKWLHVGLGVWLNGVGTALLVLANAWATFMMTPGGLNPATGELVSLWAAVSNYAWMPINIHRLVANVTFGGAIAAAYAAFKFMAARSAEERAHYDWMGYVGMMIAMWSFLGLPFAGYWLMREIYAYDQTMGITMMGGFLSWVWIIQAVVISVLFLGLNYYMWCGLERIAGGERYQPFIKYLLAVLVLGVLVWATPHSLVVTPEEVARMGGTHHKVFGVLGVMSAKMTAVNLMILASAIGFLFYRRANKIATHSRARLLGALQVATFGGAIVFIVYLGIDGYFVPPIVRVEQYSVWQVLAVLAAIVVTAAIDLVLFRHCRFIGPIHWGRMAPRSQYALVLVAVTFTWLMGLMGYVRSASRQHWHVDKILEDTSPDAFSPTLGFAANIVSLCTALFLGLVLLIFWINSLTEARAARPTAGAAAVPPGSAAAD
ncbi:MAG: cytochrome ubiquinol oxidase subunit I [Candidatus Lambdaproteobacteria bacterium]|nr:cytochrome ubiquinol oxidase subunit I [Candidatus Lambdaproteobacteria bacterium]